MIELRNILIIEAHSDDSAISISEFSDEYQAYLDRHQGTWHRTQNLNH